MSSHAMLIKGVCLTTVLVIVVSCLKTGTDAPPPEQNPFELIQKLSAGITTVTPIESARSRCLAKQHARLESCAGKHGQERMICEAVAHELIAVCEEMNPDAPAFLASSLFCSGKCATRKCDPVCQIPGGTGTCLGEICQVEDFICDRGRLFNCNCETEVSGGFPSSLTKFCSCDCT